MNWVFSRPIASKHTIKTEKQKMKFKIILVLAVFGLLFQPVTSHALVKSFLEHIGCTSNGKRTYLWTQTFTGPQALGNYSTWIQPTGSSLWFSQLPNVPDAVYAVQIGVGQPLGGMSTKWRGRSTNSGGTIEALTPEKTARLADCTCGTGP